MLPSCFHGAKAAGSALLHAVSVYDTAVSPFIVTSADLAAIFLVSALLNTMRI